MTAILFAKYLKWHFVDATFELTKAWRNILWFNLNYFSVGLLIRTYFSPWRRITWGYARGFSVGSYLFTFASNLISRVLGAMMRTVLIIVGISIQAVLLVLAALTLVIWITLPATTIIAFIYGAYLLF